MKKNKIFLMILFSFLLCSCASVNIASPTYSQNFAKAQAFQDAGRFELARQYYLLALSSANNNEAVQKIEQKLFSIERQIITLR